MAGLLRGELRLTIDIIFGALLGSMIMRLGLHEKLMKRLTPFLNRHNIPAVTGLAMSASIASSRAGAAIIAGALNQHAISERCAMWSVLMVAFPAYLRRWPTTFIMSVSIAGKAGGIFALSLLLRSAIRFVIAYSLLRGENNSEMRAYHETPSRERSHIYTTKLFKTLPIAWIFFALTYSIVPMINSLFEGVMLHDATQMMSIAGGSIAHVSAALAMAGGALMSGELSTSQAVFALILGSGLGTATRILRTNAGYYFGLFTPKVAQKLLYLNFITIMPIIILNIMIAGAVLIINRG